MPIGSYALLEPIVHELWKKQPKKVLDLGIGFGMYGAAVREWLDAGMPPFNTELIGVEAFAGYRNPNWLHYNEVLIMDIRDVVQMPGFSFDAIVFSDVIEHFAFKEGVTLINNLIKNNLNPAGVLLIGTPAIFIEQGAAYGNDFERHKSLWTSQNFKDLGFELLRNEKPCKYGHRMILAKYTKH